MAYVSKEKKAKIVAAAKKVLPKDWKVTFRVDHHSSIVATIQQAPKRVLKDYTPTGGIAADDLRVNHYHLAANYSGPTLKVLTALTAALNTDNHDRSDSMSDYFDVGHYVDINFGKYDKPVVLV